MKKTKSVQLEFDFMDDDDFSTRRTYHSNVLDLMECNHQTFMLLMDLKHLCCDRQCAEIETSNHMFRTKAIGSEKEWKQVYKAIDRLIKLNDRARDIQIFLSDHHYDTLEGLLQDYVEE